MSRFHQLARSVAVAVSALLLIVGGTFASGGFIAAPANTGVQPAMVSDDRALGNVEDTTAEVEEADNSVADDLEEVTLGDVAPKVDEDSADVAEAEDSSEVDSDVAEAQDSSEVDSDSDEAEDSDQADSDSSEVDSDSDEADDDSDQADSDSNEVDSDSDEADDDSDQADTDHQGGGDSDHQGGGEDSGEQDD